MNRKSHDVEKQRYWERTMGAGSGMSIREFCRQRPTSISQKSAADGRLNAPKRMLSNKRTDVVELQ